MYHMTGLKLSYPTPFEKTSHTGIIIIQAQKYTPT